jgi:pantoate kinase
MQIATAAIQTLETDKSLKRKVVSALKSGGTAAIGQLLNHPAASFVIAALEDWNSQP